MNEGVPIPIVYGADRVNVSFSVPEGAIGCWINGFYVELKPRQTARLPIQKWPVEVNAMREPKR